MMTNLDDNLILKIASILERKSATLRCFVKICMIFIVLLGRETENEE